MTVVEKGGGRQIRMRGSLLYVQFTITVLYIHIYFFFFQALASSAAHLGLIA